MIIEKKASQCCKEKYTCIKDYLTEPLFDIRRVSKREQEGLASQRVGSCKSAAPKILTAG